MDNRQSADRNTSGERLTSQAAYDRILRRAHAARAELLQNALFNCVHKLRQRICAGVEKLRINFCPLCCQ